MPLQEVLSVRDRAANAYGRPFFTASVGQAIRSFSDVINGKDDSEIQRHPGDFDLFHLGQFDDETGNFLQYPAPKQIAVGKDLVVKQST